jgi:hypothetical protein
MMAALYQTYGESVFRNDTHVIVKREIFSDNWIVLAFFCKNTLCLNLFWPFKMQWFSYEVAITSPNNIKQFSF